MAARLSRILLASTNPVKLHKLKMLQGKSCDHGTRALGRSYSGGPETATPATHGMGKAKSETAGTDRLYKEICLGGMGCRVPLLDYDVLWCMLL